MTSPAYQSDDGSVTLHHGDCLDVLRTMADGSVDAVVTDPPAGIGFMGKKWDHDKGGRAQWVSWMTEIAAECIRVLKPGGHALVWALPRTSHWTATAWEDAGFEVRDRLAHVFGSGFPKSLSVEKASQLKIQPKYENKACMCLEESQNCSVDAGDGGPAGKTSRCQDLPGDELQRSGCERAENDSRHPIVQSNAGSRENELRQLRKGNLSQAKRASQIETPVLYKDLCGCGTEDAGLGNAEVRAGLEKPKGGNQGAGQGVPHVRKDSEAKRASLACSPLEAIPDRRGQSSDESSGAVRTVPPRDRGDNDASAQLDPNRDLPRRVILDDNDGRQNPVARICSWCGMPDREWLESLKPLGTALKPAMEDWWLCRKPLDGTIAGNVLKHGVGGINVGACRVPCDDKAAFPVGVVSKTEAVFGGGAGRYADRPRGDDAAPAGRFPANLITDGSAEVVGMFPCNVKGKVGMTKHGSGTNTKYGKFTRSEQSFVVDGINDSGSAARFFKCCPPDPLDAPDAKRLFYVGKASKRDRDEGCEGLEERTREAKYGNVQDGRPHTAEGYEYHREPRRNHHTCVKPTALMRYLCRLITPPGGTVLDPFMGSGSTGKAAVLEGFCFVGIEREAEYVKIAEARIAHQRMNHQPALIGGAA